ncbi:MAG: hypothetical protein HQL07_16110 [Nitrospirae bacterium]|nr:hypothetical protein [Magnetococcales bacterium]
MIDHRMVLLQILESILDRNDKEKLNDNTDLLISGIMDSFGWINLLQEFETKTGLVIDFEALSVAADITTFGGLVAALKKHTS